MYLKSDQNHLSKNPKQSFPLHYTDDLFLLMQKQRNHFAIIIDEYGGMQDIVIMNDLLEEIVGDLEDDLLFFLSQH